jgi:anthranilate synthase
MRQSWHSTPHGIRVLRTVSKLPYRRGLGYLLRELDTYRGIYLSSGYEFPGRYSRWDIASVKPPLEIVAAGRQVVLRPLNTRGEIINAMLAPFVAAHPHWESFERRGTNLEGCLKPLPALFPEEERSKQPSAFSILRTLIDEFRPVGDPHFALVGAFGFDLLFQFDPIQLKMPRTGREDLHLFLCDDICFMDRKRERALPVRLRDRGQLHPGG